LYSLGVGIFSFILLFAGIGWITRDNALQFANDIYNNAWIRYTALGISLLFILLSMRFFYVSAKRGSGNLPSIDQRTEFGDIRISFETIENLALKAASRVRGVKDLKARIRISDSGLEVLIRTIVDGETSIPVLTEEVQRFVKEHVEETTGIPVAYVSVYVANILQTQSFRSRVE
jgi:uncharacterized alkaline shock family protein YloU